MGKHSIITLSYFVYDKVVSIPMVFNVFHNSCGKLVENSVGNLCVVCYHIEIKPNFFQD